MNDFTHVLELIIKRGFIQLHAMHDTRLSNLTRQIFFLQ